MMILMKNNKFQEKNSKNHFDFVFRFGAVRRRVDLVEFEKCFPFGNEYLLVNFGFDTAENEPSKVANFEL